MFSYSRIVTDHEMRFGNKKDRVFVTNRQKFVKQIKYVPSLKIV